tara:strand:- start:516 stop:773 length:258 start_codon:yes stop_codon:yes gene_type:complete
MTNENQRIQNIIKRLKAKANNVKGARMPSLREISEVLKSHNISHIQVGSILEIGDKIYINSSSTYYSVNAPDYARQILEKLNIDY